MYMLLFLSWEQAKLHQLAHHKHVVVYTMVSQVASLSDLKLTLIVVHTSPLECMVVWTGLLYWLIPQVINTFGEVSMSGYLMSFEFMNPSIK